MNEIRGAAALDNKRPTHKGPLVINGDGIIDILTNRPELGDMLVPRIVAVMKENV